MKVKSEKEYVFFSSLIVMTHCHSTGRHNGGQKTGGEKGTESEGRGQVVDWPARTELANSKGWKAHEKWGFPGQRRQSGEDVTSGQSEGLSVVLR